jgi:hypothetical protein
MKYIVQLSNNLKPEDFEKKRDNTALVYIQNKEGHCIPDQCIISVNFNQDALLGFGKSLIRYAYERQNIGGPLHIRPIKPKDIVQSLGLVLHPKSVEVIIGENLDKTINAYLKKEDNTHDL